MDSAAAPSPSVFANRAFAHFWGARVIATFAIQAESITIGWQVYAIARLTHSVEQGAFLVGMVGLVQFLPLFALTFVAGAMADRHDRRGIILCCLGVEAICVLILAALALAPHPALWPIFAISAVFGAVRAFQSPALAATGPMLVPKEILPRAIAWNSLGYQSASVIGPWIGGALCAVSPCAAYLTAAALYAIAAGALLTMRANTKPVSQGGSRLAMIGEGLVYVWTNKIVLGAISLDLVAVLLGGATALLPVYARDILKVGAHGFGVLRSGPAIGAALMAFVLSRRQIKRHAGLWMFGGVAVFGAATLVFAESRVVVLSVLALSVLGAADMISVYVRQSLIQIVTPDPMRGRVSAVSYLFVGASNELGEFETGVVARLLGPVSAAVFGGIGSMAVTGVWAGLFPSLRKADRLTAPEG
jgi:MFS family permease